MTGFIVRSRVCYACLWSISLLADNAIRWHHVEPGPSPSPHNLTQAILQRILNFCYDMVFVLHPTNQTSMAQGLF